MLADWSLARELASHDGRVCCRFHDSGGRTPYCRGDYAQYAQDVYDRIDSAVGQESKGENDDEV